MNVAMTKKIAVTLSEIGPPKISRTRLIALLSDVKYAMKATPTLMGTQMMSFLEFPSVDIAMPTRILTKATPQTRILIRLIRYPFLSMYPEKEIKELFNLKLSILNSFKLRGFQLSYLQFHSSCWNENYTQLILKIIGFFKLFGNKLARALV